MANFPIGWGSRLCSAAAATVGRKQTCFALLSYQKIRLHSSPCHSQTSWRLTPQEVTSILRANEYSSEDISKTGRGPVKSFDTNSLSSNSPIEDAHAEAVFRLHDPKSLLFGIFDGHGGAACGQVVGKRLLHYVAANLVSTEHLIQHLEALEGGRNNSMFHNLLKTFHDPFELVKDLQKVYHQSYIEHVKSVYRSRIEEESEVISSSVAERLVSAFLALDHDLSSEVVSAESSSHAALKGLSMKTLTVAMSGCVAAVAYIDGNMLHLASTGDCTAVLGSLSENDTWVATRLNVEHNTDNTAEVQRILADHPNEQARDIIRGDRLLGILAPLRAFGDFKFKWPEATIRKVLGPLLGEDKAVPLHYKSPPYLTAMPDVTSHKLTPRDKFVVIGSDGLWDMMTPMQVIRLVGEHMSGKITLSPLNLNQQADISLADISQVLNRRQAALKLKPQDSNAATHLIRNALGGTAYGVDHGRLSQMLSMPQDMVRMFRDDITVTVIYFDSDYLRLY